jgi:hypothetical protein
MTRYVLVSGEATHTNLLIFDLTKTWNPTHAKVTLNTITL